MWIPYEMLLSAGRQGVNFRFVSPSPFPWDMKGKFTGITSYAIHRKKAFGEICTWSQIQAPSLYPIQKACLLFTLHIICLPSPLEGDLAFYKVYAIYWMQTFRRCFKNSVNKYNDFLSSFLPWEWDTVEQASHFRETHSLQELPTLGQ